MRQRPTDFVGVAVVYAHDWPSVIAPVRDFEMTIEATYGLKPLPGLVLQPDLQLIIHPGGEPQIPNALAVGLNVIATP
jgi:carbohydrate-selective porin OprB